MTPKTKMNLCFWAIIAETSILILILFFTAFEIGWLCIIFISIILNFGYIWSVINKKTIIAGVIYRIYYLYWIVSIFYGFMRLIYVIILLKPSHKEWLGTIIWASGFILWYLLVVLVSSLFPLSILKTGIENLKKVIESENKEID